MADCVICLSRDGFDCEVSNAGGRDGSIYDCPVCGRFSASRNAIYENLAPENPRMTRVKRAVLSHQTRLQVDAGQTPEMLMTYDLEQFENSNPRLPTPAQQAANAIRFIGEKIEGVFQPLNSLPPSFQAAIGAPTRTYALKIVRDLWDRGLVEATDVETLSARYEMVQIDLSLAGWEAFEQERRGKFSSGYGFIALQFGDHILDPMLRDIIKPGLRAAGYELVDLRDVSKAGVIDNILRAQIRDSSFVLVDLTHDNYGAYWEAGYAEGLGKPVIYICEKSKFDQAKTHFDTNHCTTVMWDVADPAVFLTEVTATIRRSLGYDRTD